MNTKLTVQIWRPQFWGRDLKLSVRNANLNILFNYAMSGKTCCDAITYVLA